jgi:hypothetical protein
MKPIISNNRIQTLGPHPEEAALTELGLARLRQLKVSKSATADFDARPSRRMATGTISLAAVLRDARKSALLRTRLIDDIDMIRTMETLS